MNLLSRLKIRTKLASMVILAALARQAIRRHDTAPPAAGVASPSM